MGAVIPADAEPSFQQWLSRLSAEPELDIDPNETATRDWLREVHRENGDLSTRWLHMLIFERRERLAHELLSDIRRQAEAELGELTGLTVYISEHPGEDFAAGLVMIEDTAIRGLDQAEAATEVADGVQTSIIRSRQLIWPECPVHGNGLHPELKVGTAVWICSQGPHSPRKILTSAQECSP